MPTPHCPHEHRATLCNPAPASQAPQRCRRRGHVGRRLQLHPDKTCIRPTAEPAAYLGYELAPAGRRLVPANVARFRQRLDALRRAWQAGEVDAATVRQRIGAWLAHASHAHTAGLRHALLRDGWFDPFWADGRPVTIPGP